MGTTAKGLRYPEAGDSNNVPVDMQELAQDADDRLPAAMTSAVRDALASSALWDGRTIWNSTTGRRERYAAAALVWREESVSTSGGSTITTSGADVKGLVVKAASGQTANLLEVQDNAGVIAVRIGAAGALIATGGSAGGAFRAEHATPTTVGLVVKGAVSQTANLAEFQDSAGTILARILADGTIVGGATGNIALRGTSNAGANGNDIFVSASAATQRPLVVRGAASQTANLAEFQNSAGTVLAGVDPNGTPLFTRNATTAARGGGVATVLPTAPVEYIEFRKPDGSYRFVPAYS